MIQSVDRALSVLCQFNAQVRYLGITELSQLLGLPKSTVHGLVKTLEARGFLTQNPENGKYQLGVKVYELGMVYSNTVELQSAARNAANRLAARYEEAVHLAIYVGGMVVYIMKTEFKGKLVAFPRVGASIPAYATAVGKVLLAALPDSDIEKYREDELYPFTSNTITSVEALRAELAKVREQGYAVDNEETLVGIACVGAPVFDRQGRVVAALSISGPADKILGDCHSQLVKDVIQAARETSRNLGYTV